MRDATGTIRHTGRTKREAMAPYLGHLTRSEVKGRALVAASSYQLRKSTLWRFLHRHGWRCTREYRDVPIPAAHRPSPARSPVLHPQ
ncbi:hypothetical protein [Gemmatimonas sp.]